jgi:hypothetical protein
MKKDESGDYETPVEEWPGYIGMSWDGQLSLEPELQKLDEFDWDAYRDLAPTEERELSVHLRTGARRIKWDINSDIALLLDELPSIDVTMDSGPEDAGPASGSGYIFCLANNTSPEDLDSDVSALLAALNADLQTFKS